MDKHGERGARTDAVAAGTSADAADSTVAGTPAGAGST